MIKFDTQEGEAMKKLSYAARACLAIGTVATVMATSAVAQAAPAAQKAQTPQVVETQMVATGFDAKVAAANGYKVLTDANGKQYSVPKSSTLDSQASAQAAPAAVDNCGSSRVVLLDAGGGKAAVSTGFTVPTPAVSYEWHVTVAGSPGVYQKNFGGGLAFRNTWTGSFNWTVPKTGRYTAIVHTNSWALLANGVVCSSVGPSDTETIYR